MGEHPKPTWTLRVEDDLSRETADAIGAFMVQFNPGGDVRRSHSGDYYHWKLSRGPFGKGFVSLAMDGDTIAGATTVTRKRIHWNGRVVDAAEIGDTFVDSNYRRQGIFGSLVKATRERARAAGVKLFYGTPNDQSLPGYERKLDFPAHPTMDIKGWVVPIRLGSVASRSERGSPLGPLTPLVDPISAGLIARLPVGGGGCVHVPLTFGEDYGRMNSLLTDRTSNFLDRSPEWLHHRYVDNPDHPRYGLVEHRRLGKLKGFLVYKTSQEEKGRMLWVADLVAANPLVERELWVEAVRHGARLGCDLLASWGPRTSALSRLPYLPLVAKDTPVIWWKDGEGQAMLDDRGPWSFSIACSDNI